MHSDQTRSPREFLWEAGSLAKSNSPHTQLMGNQITIWQNGSDALTFHELIFDEFFQAPCAQKHTQRIGIPLPHQKKIQGVPRVYSKGKADTVDRKSPHI